MPDGSFEIGSGCNVFHITLTHTLFGNLLEDGFPGEIIKIGEQSPESIFREKDRPIQILKLKDSIQETLIFDFMIRHKLYMKP